MSTLGPYDYWAIEYAYKRDSGRSSEAAELGSIASRIERAVARVLDRRGRRLFRASIPAVNQLDLGSDPLAYAKKRLALVRELWQRTEHAASSSPATATRCCGAISRAA